MENKQEHPPIKFGKTGVLIINLGTPDSTSWLDIRKYLKEFLSDRRVIEINPIIWQFILKQNLWIHSALHRNFDFFINFYWINFIINTNCVWFNNLTKIFIIFNTPWETNNRYI